MAKGDFQDRHGRREAGAALILGLLGWGMGWLWPAPVLAEAMTVRGLRERVEAGSVLAEEVEVSGRVRSADAEEGLLAIEDASGAAVLKLVLPEPAWAEMREGTAVELGWRRCVFSRGDLTIECGMGPVVDIDGRHPPIEGRGSVYLSRGPHPVRLEWFNGQAEALLEWEIQGPGGKPARVPESWLSHRPEGGVELEPGLKFELFDVPGIVSLDDLPRAGAIREGVVRNVGVEAAGQRQDAGMRFTGFLSVPVEGEYAFRLSSDDGARVYVGEHQARWKVIPEGGRDSEEKLPETREWVSRRGKVTYAAFERERLRLELAGEAARTEVMVLNPRGLDAMELRGRVVTVSGVGYEGGVAVLGSRDLRGEPHGAETRQRLTSALEVRELPPGRAAEGVPVVLDGVVTMANHRSMVIQDESGGIFVLAPGHRFEIEPKAGERWEVRGTSGKGDFAPVVMAESVRFIDRESLPPPRRPTWEELLNGRLDAELVEVEGVITAAESYGVELLTRDGTVVLQAHEYYPLPAELRTPESREKRIGARVRLRGVYGSSWDRQLERLHPGIFRLGNAMVALDEPAPESTEEVPLTTIQDLWQFTSKSTALNRVRLKARMMAKRNEWYLLSDGEYSLRLESKAAWDTVPGDLVEVVGFARIGMVSPVLVHPSLRVESRSALPAALEMPPKALPDLKLDGKMVALEAKVLSDTLQQDRRSLELEAGALRFLAVGEAKEKAGALLERDTVVRVSGVYFGSAADGGAPGTGAFELRLASPAGIEILAKPPWWTSERLAKLIPALLGGLALVIGWAVILHRMVAKKTSELAVEIAEREHAESERMIEVERARVARDLHDELGAGLTEIGMLSSLLGNAEVPPATKEGYVETLKGLSRSLVGGLDEIVWAINPSYDSVEDAASYLWLYAQRMLKPAGIECRLDKRDEILPHHFGSRRRHSLFLAFKEALNNVVRHSEASEVVLGIAVEEKRVVVTLSDDGRGFDSDLVKAPGDEGLTGMRQRMQEFGGDCQIASEPGHGTTVQLILPLRPA